MQLFCRTDSYKYLKYSNDDSWYNLELEEEALGTEDDDVDKERFYKIDSSSFYNLLIRYFHSLNDSWK